MNIVYLITGSNIGNRLLNLKKAEELIVQRIGNLISTSHIFETEAWGYTSVQFYYNQCFCLESGLGAELILKELLGIEREMGRKRRGGSYEDRIVDIDILFYNDEIINTKTLTIPHPKLHERKFVMVPLVEIAGDFIHPVFGKSIERLLLECDDKLKVTRVDII